MTRLDVRGDGVAVLTIDDPREPVNTDDVEHRRGSALDRVDAGTRRSRGVGDRAAAKKDFVVGANIDVLKAFRLAERRRAAREGVRRRGSSAWKGSRSKPFVAARSRRGARRRRTSSRCALQRHLSPATHATTERRPPRGAARAHRRGRDGLLSHRAARRAAGRDATSRSPGSRRGASRAKKQAPRRRGLPRAAPPRQVALRARARSRGQEAGGGATRAGRLPPGRRSRSRITRSGAPSLFTRRAKRRARRRAATTPRPRRSSTCSSGSRRRGSPPPRSSRLRLRRARGERDCASPHRDLLRDDRAEERSAASTIRSARGRAPSSGSRSSAAA